MKRTALAFMWSMLTMSAFSQYTISGVVTDEQNNPLPGANLMLTDVNRGTVTSADGTFFIGGLPGSTYTLMVTFVGYETWSETITLSADLDLGTIGLARTTIMGEEVIITAIRAGSKTPVAYTVIDREEITSRNFGQDVPYLLSFTPSLVTTSDAGHGIGYTSMRIRGTDANRINVTINGIPLNDAESHSVYWVDLPDISTSVDNIQIQRGVGTSTNGAAAFGASINFQTQKLEKEPYAIYDGTFGSFHSVRNAISAGTGLIKDHFAVDLRLSDLHSNGYIDRSWTDLQSYYVSAGYFDSKTLVKFITFSGKEKLYQAWNGVPSYLLDSQRTYNELGAYTNPDGNIAYYDNQVDNYRQDHYQLHLSRAFNERFYANVALHYTKGAGYYEQYKEDQSLSSYLLDDVVIGGDTIGESDLIRRKWLDNDFYGFVGGLHYRTDRFSAILGGGWNQYEGDHFGTVIWIRQPGESEIRHRWYENNGMKSDWNSYLKINLETGERISLFTDLQVRGIDYSIQGADDDLRDITQDHHYLFFNPKAGINLQVDRFQKVYIFVARANREPNRSNFVDADPSGPAPVKETMVDYEAGYTIQGQDYNLSANVYYMDYTDQLVLTGEINDVGSAIMTNVKDSYRAGVELAGSARFTSWFQWDFNITFSRNKILHYTGYVDNWDYWSDPVNESYQVKEELGTTDLSFSPGIILNSRLDFQPVQHLHVNLVSRYVGKQYIDNTSSEERILNPYFINDFRISYAFYPQFMNEISVQLQVLNLFNVEYETNAWIYRYYQGGMEGSFDGFYPQAGTHLMAGIRLRF
ncbi:MAG: TonB-dependent receptor [Bacteroidales bacterium]|nr:TonB-dependent receptor [Bacteroidales bacterium]